MTMHGCRLFVLVGVLLLGGSPAFCAEPVARAESTVVVGDAAPVPVVLAGGWGIGKWFSGGGARTRVVQFCVATMCVALFIMMRKLR
ncbi:MAG TPA: hypothetical protein VN688_10370 [Gemmataceae bacterium]|nr:hypothetical protein [Gemmataceae bacterium]